ncbi:MAG: hypothetical protein JW915_18705 [Chitinispirillaceae bacterium]|nr:hypothetical protein [Chitinispirillaceae bacterium]
MKLSEYFESTKGTGVLSTADSTGKVDAAIYGRPHFINEEEDQVAFIMADKVSHANLQTNPSAVYLFKENDSYEGWRLYLTRTGEEKNSLLIDDLRRSKHSSEDMPGNKESKFLVYFKIDKVRPLIGDK